jgi:hypothetical protein
MNLLSILIRLTTGFLLAWGLTSWYGSDVDPLTYLASLFVAGGVSAALLDRYDRFVVDALLDAGALVFGHRPHGQGKAEPR